jgi:hypothetical protein
MQPFRAKLTDDAGQAIGSVEGSIDSPEATQAPRRGEFEFQENDLFMQGMLDQKTFCLELDDGSRLSIRVGSVSAMTGSGSSRVEFSVV